MKTNAVFMFAGALIMFTAAWMVSPPAQPLPNVEATVQAAIDNHVAEYHADDLPRRIDDGSEVAAPVLLGPPANDTIYSRYDKLYPTNFRWQWDGELKPNMMFEVRIWRDGLDPVSLGAYDVKHVKVISTIAEEETERRLGTQNLIYYEGDGVYRLPLNPRNAKIVERAYKTYLWTVGVVQIDPYKRISPEPPGRPVIIVPAF